MRGGVAAILVVAIVIISAAAGYFAGISTTVRTVHGPTNQCGLSAFCSVESPSGLVLTISIRTTSVMPNASLWFEIDEFNPTTHYINLSYSAGWILPSLRALWPCYHGAPPFGMAVFRGYYTLQNVTSATDVMRPNSVPHCPALLAYATGFSISPWSNQIQILYSDGSNYTMSSYSDSLYTINYGTTSTPDMPDINGGYSLGSSQPAVYTIAAGDEWGALLLFHFAVVAGSS